jgi:hypothetical protein
MGIGHLPSVCGTAGADVQSRHSGGVLLGGKSDLDIGHGLNKNEKTTDQWALMPKVKPCIVAASVIFKGCGSY